MACQRWRRPGGDLGSDNQLTLSVTLHSAGLLAGVAVLTFHVLRLPSAPLTSAQAQVWTYTRNVGLPCVGLLTAMNQYFNEGII